MSDKRFMVYAIDKDPANNISIECSDIDDMDKYANACKEQGYIEVRAKAKPVMENKITPIKGKHLDAMAHCSEEIKVFWIEQLELLGVQVRKA
ncbi:MAG: hypothetical protein ACYDG6_06885 [Thermincolia bacterium]